MSANRAPNPLRCSEANKARRGSAYGTKELITSLSVRPVVSPQRGGGTQERLLRGISGSALRAKPGAMKPANRGNTTAAARRAGETFPAGLHLDARSRKKWRRT
eukprot:scaffold124337_cov66-Phaeocystis_antarctica.AAC.4